MLRRNYGFCIGAACYPEKHPEAATPEDDLVHLKLKAEAGADFLVSQLFFDNEYFFEFERRARIAGIGLPILPGLMPITNFAQIQRFVAMCGASIPPKLRVEMEARKGDDKAVEDLGVAYASMQALGLLQSGPPGHSLLHAQPLAGDARHRLVALGCKRLASRLSTLQCHNNAVTPS